MDNVIDFPRSKDKRVGRDAAFELLMDMVVETMTEVTALRTEVEELKAKRHSPGRKASVLTGDQQETG